MPNLSYGIGEVTLPKCFYNDFLYALNDEIDKDNKYFLKLPLSTLQKIETVFEDEEIITLRFNCFVPWTFERWMNDYHDKNNFVSIESVIKQLKIKKFNLIAREEGVGFRERIVFDEKINDKPIYECQDIWKF